MRLFPYVLPILFLSSLLLFTSARAAEPSDLDPTPFEPDRSGASRAIKAGAAVLTITSLSMLPSVGLTVLTDTNAKLNSLLSGNPGYKWYAPNVVVFGASAALYSYGETKQNLLPKSRREAAKSLKWNRAGLISGGILLSISTVLIVGAAVHAGLSIGDCAISKSQQEPHCQTFNSVDLGLNIASQVLVLPGGILTGLFAAFYEQDRALLNGSPGQPSPITNLSVAPSIQRDSVGLIASGNF